MNYLLFGRQVEKVKNWLHRITAPPAQTVKQEAEAQPTVDVALHRSYQNDQPPEKLPNGDAEPAPFEEPITPTPPPVTEPEPTIPTRRPVTDSEPTTHKLPLAPALQTAPEPPAEPAPVTAPTPPPEGDDYNEDEDYLQHMANADEEPQPGAVNADDLLVLLSVFSKGKSATQQEITTARRAMRAISGSQIEQAILDQLNGKDGYVMVMLDMITKDLHAEDEAFPLENKKSIRAFRLEDFV